MTLEEYVDFLDAASRRDPLLTVSFRRLLIAIAFRATEGWTMSQLMGFAAYRKRVAQTAEEKREAERALRALKGRRWGLRRFCEQSAAEARERQEAQAEAARQAQEEREARTTPRRLFYEEIREKSQQIVGPRHGSRSRRRHKPAPRRLSPKARAWADLWRRLARASRNRRRRSTG